MKEITVLGINDGHDCGAALVRNGKVLAAIQEERLSNKKHHSGTPIESIKQVYKISGIHPSETSAIAVVSLNRVYSPGNEYPFKVKVYEKLAPLLHGKSFANAYVSILSRYRDKTGLNNALQELGIQDKELFFIEHHTAHASCAYRSAPWGYDKPVLVMTSDGAGDGLSSTVSVAENGEMKRIASSTFYNSLGNSFYSEITRYLGMKPWDHEFKCIAGDTPILLADGLIKPIDKIFEETALNSRELSNKESEEVTLPCSIDVLSPDSGLKLVRAKATHVYRKRVKYGTLVKVRTKTGREVTTTPNHKFLTLDENGATIFVESSHLQCGQFVGVPNKLKVASSPDNQAAHLQSSRAKIIGYVVTDGTIRHVPERHQLDYYFSNNEITLHNLFGQACKQIVGKELEPRPQSSNPSTLISRVHLWNLRQEWFYPELLPGSSSKDVPNIVLSMRDEDVAHFLRAAFDCDGGVIVNKNGSSCVVFTTTSRRLSNKIAYLLLRMGIFPTLSPHDITVPDFRDKTKKRTFHYYRVKITGHSNLLRFENLVGFDIPSKKEKLTRIIEAMPSGSTKIDLLPVHQLVKKIVLAQEPHWKMYVKYVHWYRKANHGRKNIQELVRELRDLHVETKETRRLKTLVESDLLWDRVESVESVQVRDTFVYDLYVPEYHTFVGGYGAMILHNTMGLAPYGKAEYCEDKMKKIIRLNPNNPLEFQNTFGSYLKSMQPKLQKLLSGERFDNIAAACQAYYEELFTAWVKNAIEKTGIHNVAFAGGNILNVKENKRVVEMEGVSDAFFYPPAGDEGTPAGAALEAYYEICKRDGTKPEQHPLEDLYNGPEFSDEEIFAAIKAEGLEAKADKYSDGGINEVVGELLSKGKIAARFSGRVENGPRSLGNRSIIADPRNFRTVREINTAIKQRDFWMPFAPSILEERAPDYMVNPKPARYMILAFDSQEKTRDDLPAAMHPQDFTVRPQTVNSWNPGYRRVIERFQALTGVGAVLNTSFNLHGYPIAGTPSLAIWTLKNSGLEYLAMGSYLIHKN